MTLDEIAAALGLNEKTVDRDSKSIAASFRAGGIELATLTMAEVKFVAAVIVVELQKKCPEASDLGSGDEHAPRVATRSPLFSSGQHAGLPIPRRWSKP